MAEDLGTRKHAVKNVWLSGINQCDDVIILHNFGGKAEHFGGEGSPLPPPPTPHYMKPCVPIITGMHNCDVYIMC